MVMSILARQASTNCQILDVTGWYKFEFNIFVAFPDTVACTLQAEPAFPYSSPSSMLLFVGQFPSKILVLPGFHYFSVKHAQSFHDNAKIF